MKNIISVLCFLFAYSILPSCAQTPAPATAKSELTWYTDAKKAEEISNKTKKPIFGFFTGSDWCGWCMKLHRDVLNKPAFIEWAKKNVVLLELDFPRRTQLPPEQAQQNAELASVFKVQGYPTVWFFYITDDPVNKKKSISALGSVGYPQGAEPGKEEVKFLNDANAILANQPKG